MADDKHYQLSLALSKFPLLRGGNKKYDRALLGRIAAGKTLNKEERIVAKNLPPQDKKKTYPAERFFTNPIAAGVTLGASTLAIKASMPKVMGYARKMYEEFAKSPAVQNTAATKMLGKLFTNPETHATLTAEEVTKKYTPTVKQMKKSFINSALVGGGLTAIKRKLHPRALLGEIINEHKQTKQKDPSEYIRTKLREDLQLKHQGHKLVKQSNYQEKDTMDNTVAKLLQGVSNVMIEKTAMDMAGMGEKAKGMAMKGLEYAKKQGLNAMGKGEVASIRSMANNPVSFSKTTQEAMKAEAMKKQLVGAAHVGGAAVGLGAAGAAVGHKEKTAEVLEEAAALIEKLAKENEKLKKDKKEDEKEEKHEKKESKKEEKEEHKDKMSKEEFVERFVKAKKEKKEKE
jgi:hypothetical protein